MKLLSFLLLFVITSTFAQADKTVAPPDDNYKDTTYRLLILPHNLAGKKIIDCSFFKYADIYISYLDFDSICGELSKEDFIKSYKKTLREFEKLAKHADTINYNDINMDLQYIISDLLKQGQAKVFDKKLQQFTDTIYQRPERFGSQQWRFYYLPDKTSFFSCMEKFGILDHDNKPTGNYEDYKNLGEQIQKQTGRTKK